LDEGDELIGVVARYADDIKEFVRLRDGAGSA
jgi:hypothetical protein